jgi:hypothetical protein
MERRKRKGFLHYFFAFLIAIVKVIQSAIDNEKTTQKGDKQ